MNKMQELREKRAKAWDAAKAYLEEKAKRKADKDDNMKAIYELTSEAYHCLLTRKYVPEYLVNAICTRLYKSATDRNYPADKFPPVRWFESYENFDIYCVEAFRLIRKYVNCQKAHEVFIGKAKWVRQRRSYTKKPEVRIWQWFSTAFVHGLVLCWQRDHKIA